MGKYVRTTVMTQDSMLGLSVHAYPSVEDPKEKLTEAGKNINFNLDLGVVTVQGEDKILYIPISQLSAISMSLVDDEIE